MKLQDARTIPAAQLTERREQAVALHKQGMTRLEIAPIVGVHCTIVGMSLNLLKKMAEG